MNTNQIITTRNNSTLLVKKENSFGFLIFLVSPHSKLSGSTAPVIYQVFHLFRSNLVFHSIKSRGTFHEEKVFCVWFLI